MLRSHRSSNSSRSRLRYRRGRPRTDHRRLALTNILIDRIIWRGRQGRRKEVWSLLTSGHIKVRSETVHVTPKYCLGGRRPRCVLLPEAPLLRILLSRRGRRPKATYPGSRWLMACQSALIHCMMFQDLWRELFSCDLAWRFKFVDFSLLDWRLSRSGLHRFRRRAAWLGSRTYLRMEMIRNRMHVQLLFLVGHLRDW